LTTIARGTWYTTAVRTLWLVGLAVTAACYETPKPDCGFLCGPEDKCPDGYTCRANGRCVSESAPESLVCAAPPDARVDDAPVDAVADAP
jgi:hypothetical protein